MTRYSLHLNRDIDTFTSLNDVADAMLARWLDEGGHPTITATEGNLTRMLDESEHQTVVMRLVGEAQARETGPFAPQGFTFSMDDFEQFFGEAA